MKWQSLKRKGDPIYVAKKAYGFVNLKSANRVVHTVGNVEVNIDTRRCVRFDNRWHPLHEIDEADLLFELGEVRRNYSPVKREDLDRPFILTWEKPGKPYPVFYE